MDLEIRQRLGAILFRNDGTSNSLHRISPTGFPAEFTNYTLIQDRKKAINFIINKAQDKDVVILVGKGHETYQEFADTVVPFDDRQVARELLSRI